MISPTALSVAPPIAPPIALSTALQSTRRSFGLDYVLMCLGFLPPFQERPPSDYTPDNIMSKLRSTYVRGVRSERRNWARYAPAAVCGQMVIGTPAWHLTTQAAEAAAGDTNGF